MKHCLQYLFIGCLLLGALPALSQTSGKIIGTVTDSVSGTPLEFATIAILYSENDSLVGGSITDEQGHFEVEQLRSGSYNVKVDFLGYGTRTLPNVVLEPNVTKLELGSIYLSSGATELQTAEVVAERSFIQNSIDRKVYQVDKNLVSEGGGATDVLQNIPSVDVDIDGNISLRGSDNVTILIDGKPSGLTGSSRKAILSQLPAGSIERIEVITNPSAKYDPDGMSGIINVVLKKNKAQGTNGSIALSAGTRDKYSGTANINYRKGKINLYSNYNYQRENRFRRGETERDNLYSDTITTLDQNSRSDRLTNSHLVKVGLDYDLNTLNSINLNGLVSVQGEVSDEKVEYRHLDALGALTDLSYRFTDEDEDNFNVDYGLIYTKRFKQAERQFSADFRLSMANSEEIGTFDEEFYNSDETRSTDLDELQNNVTNTENSIFIGQMDYTHPLSERTKLETGIKSIIRNINNDFRSESYDYTLATYRDDSLLSNEFNYEEGQFSWYGIYSGGIKKFSYQVGTRLEQTNATSKLITTNTKFNNDYFSVFPSVHLSQKLNKEQEVQLSYSRRINRPSVRSLNPFTDYSDPLNLRFGNPFLLPEYIGSYELSYARYWKSASLTSSLYYRDITNVIRRVRRVDSAGISSVTPENLNSGISYGLEVITTFEPYKWWDNTLSFNFFRQVFDGSNVAGDVGNDAFTWTAKWNSFFEVRKGLNLQVSGRYRAPGAHSQGDFKGMFSTDLGLKQSLWKGRGSLGLRVSDILNTRQFAFDSAGEGYYQEAVFKRESRIGFLTFSYRFGTQTKGERKRTRRDEGFSGGEDG